MIINLRRPQQGDFGNLFQELRSGENLFFNVFDAL